MKQTAKILAGSVVLYFVMAACAAEERAFERERAQASSGGQSSGGSGNGTSGASGGSGGGSGASTSNGGTTSGGIASPVPDALAEDGSRLRAVNYVAEDGAKQWAYKWRDTDRNEECTFGVAADGKTRCIPTALAIPGVYYGDASCSVPVMYQSNVEGCGFPPPPSYMSVSAPAEQCATYALRIHQAVSVPGSLYQRFGEGACTVVSLPVGSYRMFRAGNEVPASSFVQATVQ